MCSVVRPSCPLLILGTELCCRAAGVALAVPHRGVEAGVKVGTTGNGVMRVDALTGVLLGSGRAAGLRERGTMPSALSAAIAYVSRIEREFCNALTGRAVFEDEGHERFRLSRGLRPSWLGNLSRTR
jgi:hypothetical protein